MILGIDATNIKGGGITHIKNILQYPKAFKFKKIVIWGNKEVLKNIKGNKKIKKIHLNIFEKNLLFKFIWFLFFFVFLKKEKCDCVFFPSGFYFYSHIPKTIFIQNLLPFNKKLHKQYNLNYKIKFFLQKILFIFSCNRANQVIVPSKYTKKIISNLIKKDVKIFTIYHGATKKFIPYKKKNKIKAICLSSLEPFKNLENLFKAIYFLNEKKKLNIKLDLLGPRNHEYSKRIINYISEINKKKKCISYLGNKKFEYIYKGYNILISTSKCESFGLPLVEGLCSGIKVSCSNLQVYKEILGKHVNYFNPDNFLSIAKSIQREISKKNINFKNTNFFKKKFSWNKTSKKTFEKIYSSINNE